MNITISLVSYNQRADLELLLPTLMPAAEAAAAEVFLVDNRSQDGTSDFVTAHFEGVSILRNEGRAGYGENHNLNLRRANGKYFAIMNSDMLVHEEEIFVGLAKYLDKHADVGIVTVNVLNEDGTIQGLNKRYPTVLDLALRRYSPRFVKRLARRRLERYEMRDVGYDREYDVPFISGAFMFCRTDILRAVGGFDPAYFLYFEDVDLCRRVQENHRTVFCPDYSVTHFWQRASHVDPRQRRIFIQSGMRYFRRWGLKVA